MDTENGLRAESCENSKGHLGCSCSPGGEKTWTCLMFFLVTSSCGHREENLPAETTRRPGLEVVCGTSGLFWDI